MLLLRSRLLLSSSWSLSVFRSFSVARKSEQRKSNEQKKLFDRIRVVCLGGKGGDGCISFLREKYRPKGGPAGGNGGHGGSVIMVASDQVPDLRFDMFHFRAKPGTNGQSKQCHGRAGKDLIVRIPVGTVVKRVLVKPKNPDAIDDEEDLGDLEPELVSNSKMLPTEILADLDQVDQQLVVSKGGKGGRGNMSFASIYNTCPRMKTDGTEGEITQIELELKTVADVGLVGFPNAGKSTFLGAISNVKPKVADYPFTTLRPWVGHINFPDYFSFTVADLPGLVKGAHANVGLGHKFLRHIERCKVLVYVLDASGLSGTQPWVALADLREELRLYLPTLLDRPMLVIANKMDLESSKKNLKTLRKWMDDNELKDIAVLPVCAKEGQGMDKVTKYARELVEKMGGGTSK